MARELIHMLYIVVRWVRIVLMPVSLSQLMIWILRTRCSPALGSSMSIQSQSLALLPHCNASLSLMTITPLTSSRVIASSKTIQTPHILPPLFPSYFPMEVEVSSTTDIESISHKRNGKASFSTTPLGLPPLICCVCNLYYLYKGQLPL